ncbi:MAG: cupin [Bacteroidetes bacterium OLB12]|nr:MAG: cupin [Bacteroidetes bacterium OLB12]
MKKSTFTWVVIFAFVLSSCVPQRDNATETNLTFPKGNKINNANFTGTAYLQPLMEADSINPTSVATSLSKQVPAPNGTSIPEDKFYW